MELRIEEATGDRWGDLEALFGPNGAYGNCWCMWWRVSGSEFDDLGATGRKRAFRDRVGDGVAPGLLAYDGDTPVGWIAVAPRGEFGRLQRSPNLKPVDDADVWSITCFFIARTHRDRGVASRLVAAATAWAFEQGAEAVEAYPAPDTQADRSAAALYMGTPAMFTAAGYEEVLRRGHRQIMRAVP